MYVYFSYFSPYESEQPRSTHVDFHTLDIALASPAIPTLFFFFSPLSIHGIFIFFSSLFFSCANSLGEYIYTHIHSNSLLFVYRRRRRRCFRARDKIIYSGGERHWLSQPNCATAHYFDALSNEFHWKIPSGFAQTL